MTADARPPAVAAALARLYDLDLADDPGDVDLYLALAARTGGPVLELAVGSGRVAVPLAEAGYRVTGIDNDPAMLARARDAASSAGDDVAARLTFAQGDMTAMRLPDAGSFRLALVALNSLLVLASRRAQREALGTLAAHLAPGGVAVIDAWQPDADDLARFDGRLILEWARIDPASGSTVTKTASAQYDAPTRTVTLTTIFDEGRPGQTPVRWLRTDRLRLVSADELCALAEDAGLVVEQLAGGYGLEALEPGADRAVLVAVRP